jgi:lipid II:glycine glycyltransferase (peptidoglycan interpeptide bridge formation enzyme)
LKGRSQIRHAMSAGVEARPATPEDIPAYYEILKGWSERKELPCPSLEFLQESFRLSNSRRLFVALYEGKIIAGTPVRFYPAATAEYAWNASLPEFQHLRPNDLLHWRIIEWACQQAIHTYLLGATHAFLLKYSDRIIPTYQYTKDQTLLKTHNLKADLTETAVGIYRRLPPGVKEKLKQLRK